jgi:hypothetical protein
MKLCEVGVEKVTQDIEDATAKRECEARCEEKKR